MEEKEGASPIKEEAEKENEEEHGADEQPNESQNEKNNEEEKHSGEAEERKEEENPEETQKQNFFNETGAKFGQTTRSKSIKSPRSSYSRDSKSKLSVFSSRFGTQSRFNQLSSGKSNLLPNSMEIKKIQEELSARTVELQELLEAGMYKEAEGVNLRIEKLKEEELVVQTSEFMKKNKFEAENLKKINEEQLAKFNEEWERIIEEHKANVEKIESDFVGDQQHEIAEFNEKLKGFQIPPVKLSSRTLNLQKVLGQMLKQKK